MARIKPVTVDQHAPEIQSNAFDGQTIKLSDLKDNMWWSISGLPSASLVLDTGIKE